MKTNKKILILASVAIILVLILVLSVSVDIRIIDSNKEFQSEVASDNTKPITAQSSQDRKKSIQVKYSGVVLVLEKDADIAVVDFTEVKNEGSTVVENQLISGRKVRMEYPQWRVFYRYRFLDGRLKKETAGKGELFERYNKKQAVVADKGGQNYINAGEIRVEWSVRDAESAWIYFDPLKYKVRVVDDALYQRTSLADLKSK